MESLHMGAAPGRRASLSGRLDVLTNENFGKPAGLDFLTSENVGTHAVQAPVFFAAIPRSDRFTFFWPTGRKMAPGLSFFPTGSPVD